MRAFKEFTTLQDARYGVQADYNINGQIKLSYIADHLHNMEPSFPIYDEYFKGRNEREVEKALFLEDRVKETMKKVGFWQKLTGKGKGETSKQQPALKITDVGNVSEVSQGGNGGRKFFQRDPFLEDAATASSRNDRYERRCRQRLLLLAEHSFFSLAIAFFSPPPSSTATTHPAAAPIATTMRCNGASSAPFSVACFLLSLPDLSSSPLAHDSSGAPHSSMDGDGDWAASPSSVLLFSLGIGECFVSEGKTCLCVLCEEGVCAGEGG
ncbi:uncharacterized protein LOC110272041 [Arachis ipaensis]|uniref:uncharacterized protein LOC110272041 n=1 Tax=Arachis ipaensis TaxID=130454 RepID=UPI000A2B76EA|nr:uncharacterized protein LOC110272041 [Arachis ipaensis]